MSSARRSCGALGSLVTANAFATPMATDSSGIQRITSTLWKASAIPLIIAPSVKPTYPRPERKRARAGERARRPHLLRAHPIHKPAGGVGHRGRDDSGDSQTEADLGGRQADDFREEHGAPGVERALRRREQQR